MRTLNCTIPATLALFAVAVSAAGADDAEEALMRRVRLTTDRALTAGCTQVSAVRDDSVKDLRKKIVRAGGDTALLSFGVADMEDIYADVFRCPTIPPPPPGAPPPPPGAPAREPGATPQAPAGMMPPPPPPPR
jgi:hypothetical protein